MPWPLLVWLLAFVLQSGLLGICMYQLLTLSDLGERGGGGAAAQAARSMITRWSPLAASRPLPPTPPHPAEMDYTNPHDAAAGINRVVVRAEARRRAGAAAVAARPPNV